MPTKEEEPSKPATAVESEPMDGRHVRCWKVQVQVEVFSRARNSRGTRPQTESRKPAAWCRVNFAQTDYLGSEEKRPWLAEFDSGSLKEALFFASKWDPSTAVRSGGPLGYGTWGPKCSARAICLRTANGSAVGRSQLGDTVDGCERFHFAPPKKP